MLVEKAVEGDRRAVEDLLAVTHRLVLSYCRARLGGSESVVSAEDVAQEVCMTVLTALPSYGYDLRSFRSFLYAIASHKVNDDLRIRGRAWVEPVAAVPDTPDEEPGPEEQALQEQISRLADLVGAENPVTSCHVHVLVQKPPSRSRRRGRVVAPEAGGVRPMVGC